MDKDIAFIRSKFYTEENGMMLYSGKGCGRVYFNLDELPYEVPLLTENNNTIIRLSKTQIELQPPLGESIFVDIDFGAYYDPKRVTCVASQDPPKLMKSQIHVTDVKKKKIVVEGAKPMPTLKYHHEAKLYEEQVMNSATPKSLEDVRIRYENAKAAGINLYAPQPTISTSTSTKVEATREKERRLAAKTNVKRDPELINASRTNARAQEVAEKEREIEKKLKKKDTKDTKDKKDKKEKKEKKEKKGKKKV